MKRVLFLLLMLYIASFIYAQSENKQPKKIVSKKKFEVKAEKPNFMFQLARKNTKINIEFDKKLRQKLKKSNRLLY